MSKSLQGYYGPLAAPSGSVMRRGAAFALRGASKALARLSRRLRAAEAGRGARRAPELEFYAEAGAPEGALYVDGEYVGHVPGVRRL
ncbi:hypothetical protein HLB44_03800 [Aquincola sp. S2]|uniref:Uncharacterized protein n=1 Tax=Pseudaquabacterium terrae TaxID=2732868 RepID=A0ABX2EC15_9BURK|nr:hypothetical protein [Aquabacterium terrae]NRF66108.1 hypothetical protein [Aquabacterium terrae]